MKLIRARIINFGKFQNKEFNFNDGLNQFSEENGWGKTTLSVFIKAMFYGLEHTSSKDLAKNEKLKYFPWQGGIYGGTLTFSHKEKTYTVRRTFSLKKNEDTFELRNSITNEISNDFIENLGTELFGVNRDTYERSVNVSLEKMPEISSDISAKLTSFVEETGDMKSFDKAKDFLESKVKEVQKNLKEIEGKITENNKSIDEMETKISQNEMFGKEVSRINGEIDALAKERSRLAEQLAASAKYAKKQHYEQLKRGAEKADAERDELLDFFGGKIPGEETLKTLDSMLNEYTGVEINIKNNMLSQSEKDDYEKLKSYFSGDIPDNAAIDSCLESDNEYRQFQKNESEKKLSAEENGEFGSLKRRFENADISESKINECISAFSGIQNVKNEIAGMESDLQSKNLELKLLQQTKPENTMKIVLFVSALIFIAAGIVLLALKVSVSIGAVLLALGAVSAVSALLLKGKKPDTSALDSSISGLKNKIDSLKSEVSRKENETAVFISKFAVGSDSELFALNKISVDFSRYESLRKKSDEYDSWLAAQPKKAEDYEKDLKVFMKRFCKTDDISSVSSEIQSLNGKLRHLCELEKKLDFYTENLHQLEEKKKNICTVLSRYKTDESVSYPQQVQTVHNKLDLIRHIEDEIGKKKIEIQNFENDPEVDTAAFETLSAPEKSADELQAGLLNITSQINDKNAEIAGYRKRINDNLSFTDKKEDVEAENDRCRSELSEKKAEQKIFSKTKELLENAKSRLDANFSDPMRKGFEKYVNMLKGNLNFVIDPKLNVSLIDENESSRVSGFLSKGYLDFVNFCSRMALVDAIFTEEQPPVILDDPFVNFDDDKMSAALNLVKEMAKEKQILYFTCHTSREVKI